MSNFPGQFLTYLVSILCSRELLCEYSWEILKLANIFKLSNGAICLCEQIHFVINVIFSQYC